MISAYNPVELYLLACEFIQKVKDTPIVVDEEDEEDIEIVSTPVSIAIGRAKKKLTVYKNFDIGGDQVVKVFRLESNKYSYKTNGEMPKNREWRLRVDGHILSKLQQKSTPIHLSEEEIAFVDLIKNESPHSIKFEKFGNEYGQPEFITVCDTYF